MRFATLALVLTCSGPLFAGRIPGDAGARDRPRITISEERLAGADGSTATFGLRFHDELLNVDCFPGYASDGVTRCLPNVYPTYPAPFADASCTTPLVQVDASECVNPSYAIGGWGRVSTIAEQHAGPIFLRDASGKCTEHPRDSKQKYFTLGAEVPATKFAAFAVGAEEVGVPAAEGGTASATGIPASSGSRIKLVRGKSDYRVSMWGEHLRDEKLGVDCSPRLASDGAMRCLPAETLSEWAPPSLGTTAFADSSCTIPLPEGPSPRKRPIPPLTVFGSQVHRVLGVYSKAAPIYSTFTGKCIEAENIPTHWYFNLGPEIAPTEFVAFTKRTFSSKGAPANAAAVMPRGGSRISVTGEQFVGADGAATRPLNIRYRDEKLGTSCDISTAADGVKRCLPSGASMNTWFADANCATPLATVYVSDGPGIPSHARQATRPATETCGIKTVSHVFPVSAEYAASGPVFFSGSPGQCRPVRNSAYRYFTVGPEIPPTDFVAFTQSQASSRKVRGRRKTR